MCLKSLFSCTQAPVQTVLYRGFCTAASVQRLLYRRFCTEPLQFCTEQVVQRGLLHERLYKSVCTKHSYTESLYRLGYTEFRIGRPVQDGLYRTFCTENRKGFLVKSCTGRPVQKYCFVMNSCTGRPVQKWCFIM